MAKQKIDGVGLSLGAKLVSTNERPLIFSILLLRLFPSGGEKQNCAAFCTIWLNVLQRHVCRKVRAKNRRSDLPVFNVKQNPAKKMDQRLKTSHLKEITYLNSVLRTKVQMFSPFVRD